MERYIQRLVYDWKFSRGEIPHAAQTDCNYDGWKTVRVPHDYAIEGPFDPNNDGGNTIVNADGFPVCDNAAGRTGALPTAGCAWYRREIDIKKEWDGCEITVEFDGVMSHCDVYMNGKPVGRNVYGYTSFKVDVSDAVQYGGSNLLSVRVDQRPWESRWYPGAGIYRNVRLVVKDATNFDYHTAYLTTPVVSAEKATVAITADIKNPKDGLFVFVDITDADGNTVASTTVPVCDAKISANIDIQKPKLWSNAAPNLYFAKLVLMSGQTLLDNEIIRFGIREVVFERGKGCFVNGVCTKMKGVCLHHDLGALGTAVNESAIRRQLKLLAEMGCNSIRTSHNPPAPELLDIADEMGLYVIVEQFDQWKINKTANGYGLYCDKWAEYDFTCTIRRDRNHPCVIMWSIGNEIPDQNEKSGGATARFLANIARREDPSRKVTVGLDKDDGARTNGVTDAVDVVGWNYRPHRYEIYHKGTNDIIYGSETVSCVSSRGIYFIPDKKAISADEKPTTIAELYDYPRRAWRRYDYVEIPAPERPEGHVNSYDLSAPDWAYYPEAEFAAQDDHPYVFGEYVWTGFDYLGEPTPYGTYEVGGKLARSSYFGIFDLAGIPKDRFYSYKAKWTDKEVLHLFPHWNWKDGDVLAVHCYSSFSRAELFVNGRSCGIRQKKPGSNNCLERYRLMWDDIKFEAGELTVKAIDDNGNVLKTETVRTAGTPARLEISADRAQYTANGDDLCYVTVRVLDENGNFCPTANTRLDFSCTGKCEFIACDNGDQTDLEVFSSPHRNAFSGMAVAIFRTLHREPGDMNITVSAMGMSPVTLTVPSV